MIPTSITSLFSMIRLLGIVLDIIFLIVIIISIKRLLPFRPTLSPTAGKLGTGTVISRATVMEQWNKIVRKFDEKSKDSMRIALIDADRLIDGILKDSGLAGEHMADRLDQLAPDEYGSLNMLWRSHRIRNQLVHEDFELPMSLAREALKGYEEFLKEIKVIIE